jgi:DNA-directed RNA polymerase specialized sigma24 family protein
MPKAIPTDQQLRAVLATLHTQHSALVLSVVTRALRVEDADQAGDIAQSVWVCVWQYLLRGNTIVNPAGLFATMARHKTTDLYRSARVRREVPVATTDDEQAGTRLAQVDRPTERSANLADRPLPTLERAVELLRIARRGGDRYGVRLFSRLIDRILDAAYTPSPEATTDAGTVVELHPVLADWTGADFDSCQVLASIGAVDPAGRVTRARTALRTFRHTVRTGVAA